MPYESRKPAPLQDDSLMPSGKYKDDKMIDVPAKYLLYVYENKMCSVLVEDYVIRNLDVIKDQAEKEDKYG